jgi:hypothetical protein
MPFQAAPRRVFLVGASACCALLWKSCTDWQEDVMYTNRLGKRVPLVESVVLLTPLSVEDCRDRLERSAARTLDFSASVRVSQTSFEVQMQSQKKGGQLQVIAELHGSLHSQGAGTLVKVEVINTNPQRRGLSKAYIPATIITLIGLYAATDHLRRVTPEAVLISLAISGCVILAVLYTINRGIDSLDRQIPDLCDWLRKVLDAAPE